MDDLKDRLREIERHPAPEYWGRVVERSRFGPDLEPDPQWPARRVVVVAVGLLIGLTGVGLAIRAFQVAYSPGSMTISTSSSPAPLLPPTAFDPKIEGTFQVGPNGQTNSILYADGSLWVAAYGVEGGGGPDRSMLFRIDAATQAIIARIPIRGTPSMETGGGGIAYGYSAIWVTGTTSDGAILQRVDPTAGSLTDVIQIPGFGGQAVFADASGIWVGTSSNSDSTWVTHVDPDTLQVVARFAVKGEQVRSIVYAAGVIMAQSEYWTGNSGPCGHLTTIDGSTDQVLASLDIPDCGLFSLIGWRDQVWSANTSFVPLDPRTAEPSGPSVDYPPSTYSPRSFEVVGPDGAIWYAAYPRGNGGQLDTIARFDPVASEIHLYDARIAGIAAAASPDSIWILSYDGSVIRIALNQSASGSTPATAS